MTNIWASYEKYDTIINNIGVISTHYKERIEHYDL